jgi:hypothetical protein
LVLDLSRPINLLVPTAALRALGKRLVAGGGRGGVTVRLDAPAVLRRIPYFAILLSALELLDKDLCMSKPLIFTISAV